MSDDVTVIARCKHQVPGLTFHLYNDGHYVVTDKGGVVDEGQATMGEVHAEDAATYMDIWLEDIRCLQAEEKGLA